MNKKALISALVAVVCLIAAVIGFQVKEHTSGPKALIVKAIKAAQAGDLKAFEEAVSIEMLSEYVVTHAYELAFPEETKDKASNLLLQMAPDLELAIAAQMRNLVKDSSARNNLRPWQENISFTQRLWAETLGTEDVVYKIKLKSTDSDPFIDVEMRFPEEPDTAYNLFIGFKDTDEGLKLASLPNIAQFLTAIEPLRIERQKFHKARIKEAMTQSLVSTADATISEGSWGKGRTVLVNLALENTTDKEISYVAGDIILKRGVQNVGQLKVQDIDPIIVKSISEKTYSLHFKPLSNEAALIEAALKGNLGVVAEFTVNEIQFTDGTRLKL